VREIKSLVLAQSWFNSYAPNSYPWFITALNHGYICFIS